MDKNQIKCPNCGEVFTVDESDYAAIVKQIENSEFNNRINQRIEDVKKIEKAEFEKDLSAKLSDKDKIISELKNQISAIKKDLETEKSSKQKDISLAINETQIKIGEELKNKEVECANLEADIERIKAGHEKELASKDESFKKMKRRYQEEIDSVKDFKKRLSTKNIGEDLEKYCLNEFEKLRATAFQNSEFYKDNKATKLSNEDKASKGDFIFRDFAGDHIEYISIMFEMKNQDKDTKTKHKNEDFFKKLNKDRQQKNCEYAVLVSTLEEDNDLYNQGIVDVSYSSGYEKMYVVRPQFFIPIITLLRNAAFKNFENKKELELAKQQNIDIENFENKLDDFKQKVKQQYVWAANNYGEAIKNIEKTIESLQKTKEALEKTNKHYLQASNKADEITIRKLTSESPSLKDAFKNTK